MPWLPSRRNQKYVDIGGEPLLQPGGGGVSVR